MSLGPIIRVQNQKDYCVEARGKLERYNNFLLTDASYLKPQNLQHVLFFLFISAATLLMLKTVLFYVQFIYLEKKDTNVDEYSSSQENKNKEKKNTDFNLTSATGALVFA